MVAHTPRLKPRTWSRWLPWPRRPVRPARCEDRCGNRRRPYPSPRCAMNDWSGKPTGICAHLKLMPQTSTRAEPGRRAGTTCGGVASVVRPRTPPRSPDVAVDHEDRSLAGSGWPGLRSATTRWSLTTSCSPAPTFTAACSSATPGSSWRRTSARGSQETSRSASPRQAIAAAGLSVLPTQDSSAVRSSTSASSGVPIADAFGAPRSLVRGPCRRNEHDAQG